MLDYDAIIDKYQGTGIPYNGRNDDIRLIVTNLSRHIYYGDTKIIDYLLTYYKNFKYIDDIFIQNNKCIIYYDGGIASFSVYPFDYFEHFCVDVFGYSDISGRCHEVTQRILEGCKSDNISAITSLCINTNYILYFHSYIYDRTSDKIMDFPKKIIMEKNKYDKLFCYRQINDLNYQQYSDKLVSSGYYNDSDGLFPLLYLALKELEKDKLDDIDVKKKFLKK